MKLEEAMIGKPKTRAEEIAYDVGVEDGRRGRDKCPYMTEPFAQYWRDGHAEGRLPGEPARTPRKGGSDAL